MKIKGHEEPLMEVMILCKSRLAALEELFTGAVVPNLHFIWGPSTRVFAENYFTQFPPIHEFREFQGQALNFAALHVADAEERVDPGRRRKSIRGRSTWTRCGRRHLGLILAPSRTAGASLHQNRRRCPHGCSGSLIFTTARAAATPLLHRGVDVQLRFTRIGHGGQASEMKNPRWDEKMMLQRNMEELGFLPWSKCALFISTC
jgi:hypothetical protein